MDPSEYRVAVVGLGKIGLPLAVQFAGQGMHVTGIDINQAVVSAVQSGVPPFPGEADLDNRLQAALRTQTLRATTDAATAVASSNVVIVVVPLIVDQESKEPDFAAVDAATSIIARALQPGTLVCYETTLPVGTTRKRFAPALEAASGLEIGKELFVCFSPERVSSGRVFKDLTTYPKLVGGVDEASTVRGAAFYRAGLTFVERCELPRPNGVWPLGSSEAAELAKLAETTYRDINIAFANELARHCDGIGVDVGAVIEAANSQPFSHIHQPGVAVGGHCIPVYPHLYLLGDPEARMPRSSRASNDEMPRYCIEQLARLMGDLAGRRIAILGLAYRGGVKETAFSGCWSLVTELRRRGAIPVVNDPLYTDDELQAMRLDPFHLGATADGAVVQTDHELYRTLTPEDLPGIRAIIDGRNIVADIERFSDVGVNWAVLGRRSSDGARS